MVGSPREVWSHTPGDHKVDAAHVDESQRGAAVILVSTLCGAVLLFFTLLAVSITWYLGFVATEEALYDASMTLRKSKAQSLCEQTAVIIRPAWTIPRQFRDRLGTGSEQGGFTILAPLPITFHDDEQLLAYQTALSPYVNKELYLESTTADLSTALHSMFVGIEMVLALDANNKPATAVGTCEKALACGNMLHAETLEDYIVDCMYLDPTNQTTNVASPNASVQHFRRSFDHVTFEFGEQSLREPPMGCGAMSPLWDGQQLPSWYNFTWYGPFTSNLGWGSVLQGSVPIYNEEEEQIGRFGAIVSLSRAIRPILETVSNLKGGVAVIYTESGAVLGLTEGDASSAQDQPPTVDELSRESNASIAVEGLRTRFGVICPTTQEFITFDEYAVDTTPIMLEDYGMPPLPERWCLVVNVPRQHYRGPIDNARRYGIYLGIFCVGGFVSAVFFLGTSLALAIIAQRRMRQEKHDLDRATVQEAWDSVTKLTSPMVVVHSTDFLNMDSLQCYEEWRDSCQIKYLDNIEAVHKFKAAGNRIVFISHQWLGWSEPDTHDNVQLKVMHHAVAYFVANEPGINMYVWVDYISIAQRHTRAQAMAVASLPVYVSLIDRFVICAPDAFHRDTSRPVGLESYSRRGWCRAEMLAKACGSGIKNMWVCGGDESEMRPFTAEDMDQMSLSVYEGDFTVKSDAEKLVVPVLGLYSLILRHEHHEHIRAVKAHIDARKETFFPHSYKIEQEGRLEHRKLFGHLVDLMEDHVAECRAPGRASFLEGVASRSSLGRMTTRSSSHVSM